MLKLKLSDLKKTEDWKKAGIELPQFDVEKMIKSTKESPIWVHFGAGNIFRGFIAVLEQKILDKGVADKGIVAVETYDFEIIDRMYRPFDNLSLLAIMKADGSLTKRVVASIPESLVGDPSRKADWDRLKQIFENKSLQMVSFTITEKGYSITNMTGQYLPEIKTDIDNGPESPKSVMSKAASLAYTRYKAGKLPVAFVSMDNCSQNGEKLKKAMIEIAEKWFDKKFVDEGFLQYLKNPSIVTFPWTMIDKITPRPSEKVAGALKSSGFGDTEVICTDKKTFIAPFVNAEISEFLVVEDLFPNGRPNLEKAGVLFTDKITVEKVEKMKVCTCLNPLHTVLAVFGCVLGYTLIADEMNDKSLKKLVEIIGYDEGMPVVVHPGIIDPKDFIKEVLEVRLPNPNIPDTPQRIATDTSQKTPVRFGETIKAYMKDPKLDVKTLKFIPLAIAGWCRYLLGINDKGEKFEISSDPMLPELTKVLKAIQFGNPKSVGDTLKPILSNEKLFAVDLYKAGLGSKVEDFFKEMIEGPGAVRKTLDKYLK